MNYKITVAQICSLISVACFSLSAMIANPIISRGKTVNTSSGNASYLTDNKFNSSTFTISNNSWVAINVGTGPSKVFFNWNDPIYNWSNEMSPSSCPNSNPQIADYDLLTSSNSTNGTDGQWDTALSIKGNIVTARGHLIDFSGKNWVKMSIIKGGGKLDEIEVFNASNGSEDVWFFHGTSISANTYKGTPPSQDFADLVTQAHSGFNPVMIRAGIGCITTTNMVSNLSKYLNVGREMHYWAIEQGTNDGYNNGNSGVATFKKNMQIIIDSCKAAGIQPIIATVLATNQSAAGWQIHADYKTTVETLTSQNNLIAGPDLYTWFLNHSGDLNSDGIHPNASGAASIQRLWAEKMSSLYTATATTALSVRNVSARTPRFLSVMSLNGHLLLRSTITGTACIYTADGRFQGKVAMTPGKTAAVKMNRGVNLIRFISSSGTQTVPVVNR